MSNLNQVILQGNLTSDPELRGSENQIVRFSLAVNNGFGERRTTTFVDCVGFGKQAEIISKYLTKGSQALVRGQLMLNEWEVDGEKRRKLEVRLENVNGFFFVGNSTNSNNAMSESDSAPESEPEAQKLF